MQKQTTNEFRFTGKHMLLSMFAFFGVIITVNITMAFLASKSWTGLVVKNTYVASQKFNDLLADARMQKAAGLTSDFSYTKGVLRIAVNNKRGEKVPVKDLIAVIGRPAYEQDDNKLTFEAQPNNDYRLAIDLARGIWSIKITGIAEETPYRRDVRLLVDSKGHGNVQ